MFTPMQSGFRTMTVTLLSIFLLTVCTGQTPSRQQDRPLRFVDTSAAPTADPDLNALARTLAGLAPTESAPDAWKKIADTNSFRQHREILGASFATAEKRRLLLMKEWSQTELADVCKEGLDLFYPFSGPDIMTAHAIFPCAPNYIMFGLEPPGVPPTFTNLSEPLKARYLGAVRNALGSILNYSFFRTNDMRDDFRGVLDGLSPILLVFLAREGNEVLSARVVTFLPDGSIKERAPASTPSPEERAAEAAGIPGIRYYFKDVKDGRIKSVTYFSVDISDDGMKGKEFFLNGMARTAPYTTYIKSASYLMHRDSFARVRSFILEKSHHIIEDDSGMPLAFFVKDAWNLSFYGNYTQPIALFAGRFQKDLRNVYLHPKENGVKALPFGTGYNFAPGDSHMLVARRKATTTATPSTENPSPEKK